MFYEFIWNVKGGTLIIFVGLAVSLIDGCPLQITQC
jgi:hypothetical protein